MKKIHRQTPKQKLHLTNSLSACLCYIVDRKSLLLQREEPQSTSTVSLRCIFSASVNATNGESTGVSGNTYSSSTIVVAVGGQPPKDPSNADEVAEWAKTIEDLPMPVGVEAFSETKPNSIPFSTGGPKSASSVCCFIIYRFDVL